ncbi:TIGR04283 family arsenosugar biosynthesis glycosyltransferase [Muriicola soli]|uniref:Glycosyltransferase n=1 Tax=Muriicola soli TaxID=2507538 RepID=A0A411EBX2_9FLAO|nr:TIGR04283 family arsenosugar biosynthesis glycosyltransferase [Muriicola soli]QBA65033.1 glycosyltransferase [Muriicola soli]
MKKSDIQDISIIIPVINEEANLGRLIPYLRAVADTPEKLEFIVVDGGSSDNSMEVAIALGAIALSSPIGRASQMNRGARSAKGSILYFLHADSYPPQAYDSCIREAILHKDTAGCFRLQFDSRSRFLNLFAWFSRFNFQICRGGDQSLFITKTQFDALGGFDERYRIYEDNEFIGRIYNHSRFTVLPEKLKTSARKYRKNGLLRLQYHFARIHFLYYKGSRPEVLYAYYDKHIKSN